MAVFSLRQYFREQSSLLPLPQPVSDISSKTILVTGSNVGLGFEASVHLTQMGPKQLIATSRDTAKCEQTRASILERVAAATGEDVARTNVAAWPLDLDTFEHVRVFVDRFAAQADGDGALHALVANAGLFCPDYGQTTDGWEVMLQVNYLSTTLLSILLLPHLVSASAADAVSRLVVVSSFGHYLGTASLKGSETWHSILDTINSPTFSSSYDRYSITKLLQVMFVRELAVRLPDPTPIAACTVNPGYCRSHLFRGMEHRWYIRYIHPLVRKAFIVRSTEEGSRTLVHAAVAGDARTLHGRYLSSCEVTEESDFVFTPQGKAFSAKLWDETIAVLSRADDRVLEIVAKYLRADV